MVNCVGILNESGRNKFDAVQHEGAERIARIAANEGVSQLVHISAIGADENSPSVYSKSKALGEEGVLQYFSQAVILRPSVIFGAEDNFFNRFASMSRMGPILPLVGGKTKFQPVHVEDVAAAAVAGVEGRAAAGVYELGGPEVKTMKEMMEDMLDVIHRRKIIMNLPFVAGSVIAWVGDAAQTVTLGLVSNGILTRDQLKNLRSDNIVSEGAKGFADLGIEPTSYEMVLPEYLWRFRPSGQYDAIKDSAKNLRMS